MPATTVLRYNPRQFGHLGAYTFIYPIGVAGKVKAKVSTTEAIEMRNYVLGSGISFIDPDVWATIMAHPPMLKVAQQMQQRNALAVHVPDVENPRGATSDFSSLEVVRDIVSNCSDKSWLERSLRADDRREVFELISTRLKQIEESKDRQAFDSIGFVS